MQGGIILSIWIFAPILKKPQMGNGAQVFYTVALLLQRVVGGGCTLNLNFLRLDLKGLFGLRGQNQGAGDDKSRTHILGSTLMASS